ncbi:MAG TPA: hypothetical protein VFS56_10260 [Gemmatimonadaceae bacterium]|nr:hypothetical protein [Gemmatimonadaceae bacterium]
MRKNTARRARLIPYFPPAQPEPNRRPARSTPLSDTEILHEAELILAASRGGPGRAGEDILLPARELDSDDEDRVVAALEEMSRNEP